ncbi:MAG: glycosyl hydrolase [Flavobacteriaceae bacterium]|nr:glycosyl hydrolase [Flavobacteriaceae bacterium]|tara:strand:- start:304441 stop:307728 length:3288 start_codon:yes stop_codon:yes gene_type:complete
MKKLLLIVLGILFSFSQSTEAQWKFKKGETKPDLKSVSISGLKWRNVGPALTSGRISDFAFNPNNPFEYYVATSAGGVWKTVNAGVTYEPLFDSQGSYSIGCVTMDPNNPNVIWVGTGENNNQRSVGYGDGVYKSEDGGKSWKHMGLKKSEHIGKIIVHPENSNIVYVAAIGPLWSKGGDRGLYKTVDGGKTWKAIIKIDKHTGVNDVVMDPRDPNVLYASTLQRRRHVYTYVGGGPGSGLHKSVDGGKTWKKIQKGLPNEELGRIGLAISPANPEIIYAIAEAANGKGGFFASTNRGASWQKRSSYVTSGNYYQEIIADPVDEHTVYAMNTWMSVTKDGGKTFKMVGERTKHVDNHCMWINPKNNKHWVVGCDGGIYETFDAAKTWDFKKNLPVTQFYKVALDNAKPFYNIYGGTQDNFSLGGPSRVLTEHGIRNSEWFITNGGDGFESQVDPKNPNIVYAQSQYGGLVRYDKLSGEKVGIKPKARKGENAYRFNWDAPLAVSKHVTGRLYFAANKVFRSDDYGNSWLVISDDLSRQIDRNTLEVYDRVVSMDAVMKNGSTSPYGAVVSFSESPLDKYLLAAGTDDGLIHISVDGGGTWTKIDDISGAPKQSYVNSIHLSRHDENVIYVAFNHHKFGDFKPYIFKSMDKGKSWKAIQSNLPKRGSVYAIEEDPKDKDLLFVGTEFGAFFSPDQGANWEQLKNGLPTIAVRDIAIQERENDLVLGTFGRGFYVMDDYSVLREVKNIQATDTAKIYPIRTALMWEQSSPLGLPGKSFQGDNFYTAKNLGPEAIITYYYKDNFTSLKSKRQKKEKALTKKGADTPYPTYDELNAEMNEGKEELVFTIKDPLSKVVKKEFRPARKGIQRFHWNLRYTLQNPINLNRSRFYNPFGGRDEGTLVAPGTYTIEMGLLKDGVVTKLTEPMAFVVKPLRNTEMPAENRTRKVAFQKAVAKLSAQMSITSNLLTDSRNKIRYIKEAIKRAEQPVGDLNADVLAIEKALKEVQLAMYGDPVKRKLDIDQPLSPASRLGSIGYEQKYSTSRPTRTHIESYEIAKEEIIALKLKMEKIYNEDIKTLEQKLIKAGAPYTPGRGYQNKN